MSFHNLKDMEMHIDVFCKAFQDYGTLQFNQKQFLTRALETLWKSVTVLDTSCKGHQIDIGRNSLSDGEKWKLQAEVRRAETKIGGMQYNKRVTRAIKMTKGPTKGEEFPPGRGRPPR